MCTPACIDFVRAHLGADEVRGRSVLEMGALNVNGSVRPLVEALRPAKYVGIDVVPGPGVDVICDAGQAVERFGRASFDIVISTEMLEHVADWRPAVRAMKDVLRPGGLLLLTTRSLGFPVHHFPLDLWRFELDDVRRIFADMDVEVLEPDPADPGVLLRARARAGGAPAHPEAIAVHSMITGRRELRVGALRRRLYQLTTYPGRVIGPALDARLPRWRDLGDVVRKGVLRRTAGPLGLWADRIDLRGLWPSTARDASVDITLIRATWLRVRVEGRAEGAALVRIAPAGRAATDLGVLEGGRTRLEAYVHTGGARSATLVARTDGSAVAITEVRMARVPRGVVLGRTFLTALRHHRSRGGSVSRLVLRTAARALRPRRRTAWRDVLLVQRDIVSGPAAYDLWWRRRRPRPLDLATAVSSVRRPTTFSIVMPLFDTPEPWLVRCIDSVRSQAYPRWELCIANDASTLPHVRPLIDAYAARDERIRVVHRETNGKIVAASNSAMTLATGEFVALLDSDDELTPDALLENARVVDEEPEVDLIYSDEDKIDGQGRHFEPYLKPDWSPELLLLHMYTAHLSVYRRALLEPGTWFRSGFEGSQDYDLALRATERARGIRHIPKVLYHWRTIPGSTAARMDAKPFRYRAATRALEEALARRGAPGVVESLEDPPSYFRMHYETGGARVAVVRVPRRSDVPAIRARAAREDADVLVFLDEDLSAPSREALRRLAGQARQPGIGAVGVRVLTSEHLVEQAGVALLGGRAVGIHAGYPGRANGYLGRLLGSSNCTAVSGCLAIARERLDALGGVSGSADTWEMDLCLRALDAGLRNVCLGDLVATRGTAAARGTAWTAAEVAALAARRPAVDPYYHPDLDPSGDFSLSWDGP